MNGGSPVVINDNVLECAELVNGLDEFGSAHIVISDWNIEDDHIDHCINDKANDDELKFLNKFRTLTEPERLTVLAINEGFIHPNRR